jgi:hypothetical protein
MQRKGQNQQENAGIDRIRKSYKIQIIIKKLRPEANLRFLRQLNLKSGKDTRIQYTILQIKNVTLLSQNTAQWTENRGKYSKEQNAKKL